MHRRRFLAALAASVALVAGGSGLRAAVLDTDGGERPVPSTSTTMLASAESVPSATSSPPTSGSTTTVSESGAVEAFRTYLVALRDGRLDDAYSQLCDRARAAVDAPTFGAELQAARLRLPIRSVEVDADAFGTELEVVVGAVVGYGAGPVHPSAPVSAQMTRRDPSSPWLVCSINGGVAEGLIWPEALDPDGTRD